MKTNNIKKIELGHRQLVFGFQDENQDQDDIIMACISEHLEKNGFVIVDDLVQAIIETHGFNETDILQNIFWLAKELKIHFRHNKNIIDPFAAKKILLQPCGEMVQIITNRPVNDLVLKEVISLYKKIVPGEQFNYDDQYELAVMLLESLLNYKEELLKIKPIAEKPFYPGSHETSTYLKTLEKLLMKKDSYNLILNCNLHKKEIIEMAREIKIITDFYSNHIKFWNNLIKSMGKFKTNLPDIRKNSEISSKYDDLLQIISSRTPYNLVSQAIELLEPVEKYNDVINKKKTMELCRSSLAEIDQMIEKSPGLFTSQRSDIDKKNRLLYNLRGIKKKIRHAMDMEKIETLLNDAEDMFDNF